MRSWTTWGAALALTGCIQGGGGGGGTRSLEGESCTRTADCVSGLRCVALTCVDGGDAAPGQGGGGGQVGAGGGNVGAGGRPGMGGTPNAGSAPGAGGLPAMGGAPGVGGEPGFGGGPGAGGDPSGGGRPGFGGDPGPGGAVAPDPLVPYPGGCTADADCVGGTLCRLGICVRAPPMEPGLFSCMDQVIPGSSPALDCWTTPPRAANGSEEVPARGLLEFFGDGTKPAGLTVRFYDFATFDPSACAEAGAEHQDVIDARRAVEDCLDAASAPLAEAVTVDCPEADAESACWAVAALPTHRQLVVRISGDYQLWVPTYTYGLYINPCDNGHPRTTSGTCPSDVTDDPEGIEWGCDLQGGAQPFFYRDLTVISQATWISFPPTAGVARLELGSGAVLGRQYDCHGQSVVNAAASFARAGTPIYFNGNPADVLPQPGRVQTNARGTYASLNVPAGPNGMVSVVWQGGDLKVVGYQRFFQLPNTIVMISPSGRAPVAMEPPY